MKKNRWTAKMLVLMVAMTMLMASIGTAFAAYTKADVEAYAKGERSWNEVVGSTGTYDDYTGIIAYVQENPGYIKKLTSDSYKDQTAYNALDTNEKTKYNFTGANTVTISNVQYHFSQAGCAQLAQLVKTDLDQELAKHKVNGLSEAMNFQPDINGAVGMFSGFMGPLSLFVGAICYLAIIAITAFTAIDIFYMSVPILQEKVDASANGGKMTTNQSSNGSSKSRWVTDEAYLAMQESTTSGKNKYALYISKRGWSIILQAVAIFLLLTGNISLLSNLAISIIGSVIGGLNGLTF